MSVSLHSVSNPNLITDTRAAAAREHGATLDLLHHLVEVDERRAYLELGYSSINTSVAHGGRGD